MSGITALGEYQACALAYLGLTEELAALDPLSGISNYYKTTSNFNDNLMVL
ncbi:hypothetical protein GCM10009425_26230 [Pseudomonas asuensis]|uniref:Uncharacterized protein n=1 Tax=Pseudomonas asuensis TaxID=1825787 RepID=A0ABQ2GUG3_9PSED|nr:hypothetical protein GCM10009425_26230 [Pseudomonas asuensis]